MSADGVFDGFAARAESGAGLLPSLVSLGGIWKTSILPEARTSAVLVVLSCLLTFAAAAGLRRAVRDHPGEWRRLAGLGFGALVVAAAPAVPGGAEAFADLAGRLPGLALLRDSHRFLAPLGVVLAIGAAGAATAVRERVRPGRGALWSVVGLVVAAPVLLLPALAWGANGELERVVVPRGVGRRRRRCSGTTPAASSCSRGRGPTAATTGTTAAPCSTRRRATSRARCWSTTGSSSTTSWSRPRTPGSRTYDARWPPPIRPPPCEALGRALGAGREGLPGRRRAGR